MAKAKHKLSMRAALLGAISLLLPACDSDGGGSGGGDASDETGGGNQDPNQYTPNQANWDTVATKPFEGGTNSSHDPDGVGWISPEDWEAAKADWRELRSDEGAVFDRVVEIDVSELSPVVTWGTSPDQSAPLSQSVPRLEELVDPRERAATERALAYMGLEPGTPMSSIEIDRVFIGSCTNGRLADLRRAAHLMRGRKLAPGVEAMIVPGSGLVKKAAEAEGLDVIFKDAGADWREPGCSMCLGMNPDKLTPGQRCASTSNRNFEGRQGKGGRTHLVSPVVAAATAVRGTLSSPSDLDPAPESAAVRVDAA